VYTIASNITSRSASIKRIFNSLERSGWDPRTESGKELADVAKFCAEAGADAVEIDLQQHLDVPEAMSCAVRAIQNSINLPLCLSANKAETIEAGLHAAHRPVIINFVSINKEKISDILPMAAIHKTDIILLVSDPAAPADAQQMMEKTAVLIGTANGMGIKNENIIIDPGLIHVTSEQGQGHLSEIRDFLQALPDAFDPVVRSTCWLGNASAGASRPMRTAIEMTLLSFLAGIGLSSVFMDVLKHENIRTSQLIKLFNNKLVWAEGEFE
jgi:cobalamin-dependent methionine synthase I